MSHFRLLNERSVEKGLLALFTELAQNGTLNSLTELAARHQSERNGKVHLDGFNLLAPSGSVKPYTWFLPRPKVHAAEVLRLYEEVADQPTHELKSVGEIVGHLYPRTSDERKMVSKLSDDDQWLSPALLLAAAAQYVGAEVVEFTRSSVRMRLGTGVVNVAPTGCWSNARKRTVIHTVAPADAISPITYFPDTVTDNPVLRALYELADGSDARYAVTVAAHALTEGVINKAYLLKIARLDGDLAMKAKGVKRDPEKARLALLAADEILQKAVYDILPELFAAAVPNLLSYRGLQAIIGAPTDFRQGRLIKEETLASWRIKFQAAYQGIVNDSNV